MPHSRRSTKQVWMEKSNLRCNMACTSLKAVEEINVKEKIKQVADMQGELDLCGDVVSVVPTSVVNALSHQVDVVSVVPTSVVDILSHQVNVSITRINVGGVEESSKKHAQRGSIPSFLIFLGLFLAKKGSLC